MALPDVAVRASIVFDVMALVCSERFAVARDTPSGVQRGLAVAEERSGVCAAAVDVIGNGPVVMRRAFESGGVAHRTLPFRQPACAPAGLL